MSIKTICGLESGIDNAKRILSRRGTFRMRVHFLEPFYPHDFPGRKTIAAIRNNPDYRGLRLFAVSGSKPEDMDISFGPNGVDRWFTKPLNPKVLVDAMRDDLCTERVLA